MSAIEKLGTMLVPIRLEDVRHRQTLLDHITRSAHKRVYLALQGPTATQPPTTAVLDALVHCFESAATHKPQLDVVPLLPCLGWTPDTIASLDINQVSAATQDREAGEAIVMAINKERVSRSMKPLSLNLIDDGGAQGKNEEASTSSILSQSRVLGDWKGPFLEFDTVAVGGTFDRLHAGHRLLLAATALVTRKAIFVGITADKLLANKKNADLLQKYDIRAASAVDYMLQVNPHLSITSGPLSDPNEPPLCAVERDFDGIVVSEETIHGADAINVVRKGLGFHPLVVVVVGLIASQQATVKLSSTDLRNLEAVGANTNKGKT